MVFNAFFNNISAISWRSVLLVEETGVLGENHRSAASLRQNLSQNNSPLGHIILVPAKPGSFLLMLRAYRRRK